MIYVDIEKNFGKFNLKTKFEFDNEIMGLLGASGSGKSLTLKCIAGIEKPDKGRIVLNDRVLFDSEKKINVSPKDRKIGYLFQDNALFPNMNVYENIKVGIREGENFDKLIMEKLEEMRISHLKDKKINEISGGEKQRVALARLLINKPEIILLDEPTTGLDPTERIRLKNYLSNISKTQIIIISTHIVSDLEYLANKIFIIKSGYIIASGNESELINDCEGSVWEVPIHDRDTEYSIKNELVSMIHEDRGVTVARVINRKKISKEARLVKPTLNDAYLYYFNGDQL